MIEFPPIQDTPNFTPPPGPEWVFAQPLGWPWGVWVLLITSSLLLLLALYLKLRRPHQVWPPAPPLATHVLAINLLEELRPKESELSALELAARVTEIIRTYLHRQFGILARFRTTPEILAQRRDPTVPPPAPALRPFEDFLMHVDTLNYSRSSAPPQGLIDEAIDTIRKSHAQLQPVS